MVSFTQAKDMFRMQREAKRIKKELKNIHVEAEGRFCKVIVSGEQEVVSITINDGAPTGELGRDLTDALNRAMKKAQVVSAEKMQGIMSQMGMGMPEQPGA
jgi:DNA-binding protein YbaB